MNETVDTAVAFDSGTGVSPVRTSSHGQDARATNCRQFHQSFEEVVAS
jgi:hypothetical protein